MRRIPRMLAALAVAIVGLSVWQANAGEDKPKFTIKEVMQKAHKGGLLKKVTTGKANDDEKKELVEMYTALNKNKPPKGDEKEFKEKTEKMVEAAKSVAKGDKGAEDKLGKLVNCAECHKMFR